MPRTGRPPKPTELKRLLGNPGKRRLPAPVIALAPLHGEVLDSADVSPGANLVRELLGTAASAWIAEPDRLGVLELLRDGWNERQRLRAAVMDDPPEGLESKELLAWFVMGRKDLRDLEKQLTTWLSLLGLTPSDRGRLGIAEVKAQTSIERLRARRDARLSRSHAG